MERDGKQVRYVIDFYSGTPVDGKQVGIHIDARPGRQSIDYFIMHLMHYSPGLV